MTIIEQVNLEYYLPTTLGQNLLQINLVDVLRKFGLFLLVIKFAWEKVELNYKRFNKFEAAEYGDAPRDHQFYDDRCCYYSRCCVCACGDALEKEWEDLNRELNSGFSKGVSFFVRTYKERKELMRVVATDDQSHSLFFFDIKFPKEYPKRAPKFFYHPYGPPLSTPEASRPMKRKESYNVLDVFLHLQEILLMNTNKSCPQILDILKHPLTGFEYFVKGHFRKYAPFILRNLMEEIDMGKERDRKMFWKMYIAFEDNKANCEYLLDSGLKEELKRFKEKQEESSLNDHYCSASSPYFSSFDSMKKTSKSHFIWKTLNFLLE